MCTRSAALPSSPEKAASDVRRSCRSPPPTAKRCKETHISKWMNTSNLRKRSLKNIFGTALIAPLCFLSNLPNPAHGPARTAHDTGPARLRRHVVPIMGPVATPSQCSNSASRLLPPYSSMHSPRMARHLLRNETLSPAGRHGKQNRHVLHITSKSRNIRQRRQIADSGGVLIGPLLGVVLKNDI